MSDKKKILLICYSFPPFPGIGGRRWAKFAKYLTKYDFEIFVIGAENRSGIVSNWEQDIVKNDSIFYFPVKTKFYSFFHDHEFNFIKKLNYKFSKFYLQKTQKGNFYDKALASNELFYKKAKEIIVKHGVKNLLITIAPNRLVDVGVRLKKEFHDLNFIYDIRDPWNICLDEWDHKYLTQEQKQIELKVELEAAKTADKVFSVCEIINDFYIEHYPEKKKDYIFVPNGFDSDELNAVAGTNKKENLNYFVYTGILYDISINLFEEFLAQIEKVYKQEQNLLRDVEFHFYIPERNQFVKSVKKFGLESKVKFFDQVPLKEIQQIIANSLGGMLFLPPQFEFSLSTKFYEYVSYGKKILLFSNPGEVAKIIEEHKLGYVMLPGKMENPLKVALIDLTSGKELPKHTFPLNDYSVESLTKKIIPYFIK